MEANEQKYRLTAKKKSVLTPGGYRDVYQIQALIDIPTIGVQKGDLGGYVANVHCLWQTGCSWVFDESSVTEGSLVMQNAQVKGTSLIDGNSKIGGRSIVEDGDILDSSRLLDMVQVKQAECSDCLLYGKTSVQNSHLKRVDMENGDVFESTIQSKTGNRLLFHGHAHIEESRLISFDPTHHVTNGIEMKRVQALEMMAFKVRESSVLHDVAFIGKSELRIGFTKSPDTNTCTIKGVEEELVIRNGKLSLFNSVLMGRIEVQGKVEMKGSTLVDFTRLLNDTEQALRLEQVKLTDFVCLHKVDNGADSLFSNEWIGGDVTVNC